MSRLSSNIVTLIDGLEGSGKTAFAAFLDAALRRRQGERKKVVEASNGHKGVFTGRQRISSLIPSSILADSWTTNRAIAALLGRQTQTINRSLFSFSTCSTQLSYYPEISIAAEYPTTIIAYIKQKAHTSPAEKQATSQGVRDHWGRCV